jgi:DNA repair protein RadA/Sms
MRVSTGLAELDRVLGGGLVHGSLTLIGGDPGVGKSTLLLMALSALTARGLKALYVTGEESAWQVKLRADRLGVGGQLLYLLPETDLSAISRTLEEVSPSFLVIDSIQVMRSPDVESAPGSVNQVRATAERAMEIAKGRGIATFLVGHVTREGTLAGPRLIEHLVDTVIYFECDGRSPLRMLRAVKNRFGATGELGVFEMAEEGLREVPDASARLLAERTLDAPGTAVVSAIEGSRPLLTEVQALVGRATQGTPTRAALGLERARLNQILAVLDKQGLPMAERDVYVSAAGGARVSEPGGDLAILAAIVSSLREKPLPRDLVVFGEVGLAAEVRATGYPALRLKEAARHGFRRVLLPSSVRVDVPPPLVPLPVSTVRQAVGALYALMEK